MHKVKSAESKFRNLEIDDQIKMVNQKQSDYIWFLLSSFAVLTSVPFNPTRPLGGGGGGGLRGG